MAKLENRQVTTFLAGIGGLLLAAASAYFVMALGFSGDESTAQVVFLGLLAALPLASLISHGPEGTVFATVSIALLVAAALGGLSESLLIFVGVLGLVVFGGFLLRSMIFACALILAGAGLICLGIFGAWPWGRLIEIRLIVAGAGLISLCAVFVLRRWQVARNAGNHR